MSNNVETQARKNQLLKLAEEKKLAYVFAEKPG
jgi:hypothetical protein